MHVLLTWFLDPEKSDAEAFSRLVDLLNVQNQRWHLFIVRKSWSPARTPDRHWLAARASCLSDCSRLDKGLLSFACSIMSVGMSNKLAHKPENFKTAHAHFLACNIYARRINGMQRVRGDSTYVIGNAAGVPAISEMVSLVYRMNKNTLWELQSSLLYS